MGSATAVIRPFRPNSIAVAAPISAALVNASPAGTSLCPSAVSAGPCSVMNSGSAVVLAVLRWVARGAAMDTIVYCGSTLLDNPALTSVLDDITRRFGSSPHFLRGGAQCGALGAAALAASRAVS